MNFLTDTILALPAAVRPGVSLERLNALREEARLTNDRAFRALSRLDTVEEIEKSLELSKTSDIAFEAYRSAFYGKVGVGAGNIHVQLTPVRVPSTVCDVEYAESDAPAGMSAYSFVKGVQPANFRQVVADLKEAGFRVLGFCELSTETCLARMENAALD